MAQVNGPLHNATQYICDVIEWEIAANTFNKKIDPIKCSQHGLCVYHFF